MGFRNALTFAAAAWLAALPAAAQTVYKLIDKDGKVTYSEAPPKNFDGQVIRIDIDPNRNTATLGVDRGQPKEAGPKPGPGADAPSAGERLDKAREKLEAARKALQDAKDNPGEGDIQWLGKVGGGARPVPTDAYQQRLANLERAVKEAEDEVHGLEKQQ